MAERVVIVGGGIAGAAAASLLSEHGVPVTLLEREAYLGGRVGAWLDRHRDGSLMHMSRGLRLVGSHQRNVLGLLRRAGPSSLALPVAEARPLPARGAGPAHLGARARARLHRAVLATSSERLRRVAAADLRLAVGALGFEPETAYRDLDGVTTAHHLDASGVDPELRRVLYAVAPSALFHAEERTSAAEMLSMFHAALGADGGAAFAASGAGLWDPLEAALVAEGAEVHKRAEVLGVDVAAGSVSVRYRARGVERVIAARAVVVAADVQGVQQIVARSRALDALAPVVATLRRAPAFAVWRVWLDQPADRDRPPIATSAERGERRAVFVADRLEEPARRWAQERGGAVLELHAYALDGASDDPSSLRVELRALLDRAHPELARARVLEERLLVRDDAPAFSPGAHATRPSVVTPVPGVYLAGDYVKVPFPCDGMERAASAGLLAVNAILAERGIATEPLTPRPPPIGARSPG